MPELRRYTRFKVRGRVTLKLEESTRDINADLIDIGFLGMGIYAQEKIDAGTNVKFELMLNLLNESLALTGKGKIKYALEMKKQDIDVFRIGIEFTNLDKKTIINILNRIQTDNRVKERKKKLPKTRSSQSKYF